MTILFIYRRDIRSIDNTALIKAAEQSRANNEHLLPVFIFTPEQVSSENKYRSLRAVSVMMSCLKQLRNVQYFYGDNVEIVENLLKNRTLKVSSVYFNKDHTHYAIKRDKDIQNICDKYNVKLVSTEDYTLHPMGSVTPTGANFYSVYTPFFNKANMLKVDVPDKITPDAHWHVEAVTSRYSTTLGKVSKKLGMKKDETMHVNGGRSEAKALIGKINNEQKNYSTTRNEAPHPTTSLSAHIKFGSVSIREVYYAFKNIPNKDASVALIGQLYWNEFYDQLMHFLPIDRTLGKSNYKQKNVTWDARMKTKYLQDWKDGTTGFPFIDAGMRQLNQTGWMHNRARMAVANFLALALLIDWREGERYFAQKLVDYDVSQNNGNWQWSTGVGVDRTGYLRMYNPFSQSKKHDPECKYIKKYIPELRDVPSNDIHKWDTKFSLHDNVYIEPIVNFSERRKIAMKEMS